MLIVTDGILDVAHVDFVAFAKEVQGQLFGVTEALNDGVDETSGERESKAYVDRESILIRREATRQKRKQMMKLDRLIHHLSRVGQHGFPAGVVLVGGLAHRSLFYYS